MKVSMGCIRLSLALAVAASACTRSGPPVTAMPALEAFGQMRNKFGILVDARESSETSSGIPTDARLMPLSQAEARGVEFENWISRHPRDQLMMVLCSTPECARKMAELLRGRGYHAVTIGTFAEWKAAGLPVSAP